MDRRAFLAGLGAAIAAPAVGNLLPPRFTRYRFADTYPVVLGPCQISECRGFLFIHDDDATSAPSRPY